jgi:hypothetical protein
MVIYEYEVPGGAFKPMFYSTTQTMVTMGIFPFKEKKPMVEPGIDPGTS